MKRRHIIFHNLASPKGREVFDRAYRAKYGLPEPLKPLRAVRHLGKAKLLPPNWRNGPGLCPKHRLPAFKTEKELTEFLAANCPGREVARQGRCQTCQHWHFRLAPKVLSKTAESDQESTAYE